MYLYRCRFKAGAYSTHTYRGRTTRRLRQMDSVPIYAWYVAGRAGTTGRPYQHGLPHTAVTNAYTHHVPHLPPIPAYVRGRLHAPSLPQPSPCHVHLQRLLISSAIFCECSGLASCEYLVPVSFSVKTARMISFTAPVGNLCEGGVRKECVSVSVCGTLRG